jgi:hypothetical protein
MDWPPNIWHYLKILSSGTFYAPWYSAAKHTKTQAHVYVGFASFLQLGAGDVDGLVSQRPKQLFAQPHSLNNRNPPGRAFPVLCKYLEILGG